MPTGIDNGRLTVGDFVQALQRTGNLPTVVKEAAREGAFAELAHLIHDLGGTGDTGDTGDTGGGTGTGDTGDTGGLPGDVIIVGTPV